MSKVAIKKDLRATFGAIRDQGKRPTCLAFAASDAHASLRGSVAPLSCEYLFYCAQTRGKRGPHQGALLSNVLSALKDDGQPRESAWPYLAQLPADISAWKPPSPLTALFRRRGETAVHSVESIVAELDKDRPVITLLMLSGSFYRVPSDGVVDPGPGEQPEPAIRHAVVAAGHGAVNGQRAVLIRNSWGSSWGIGGYAWLTEAFLVPRVFQTAILLEDLSVSANTSTA